MAPAISLSIQRRINILDSISVVSIVLALISFPSVLIMSVCLSACLFTQGLVFRAYFKYIQDNFRMAKRLVFIVGNFVAIIILLLNL